MSVRKVLIALLSAATLAVWMGCSGGGDDDDSGGGDFADVAGAYTLVYERQQANDNCTTEDPDWVQGILIVEEDGRFDFGNDYEVSATRTSVTGYAFDQDLTDASGLTHVSGIGAFETSAGTIFIVGVDNEGIVADYDTNCRVRGTYAGARTTGTG